MLESLNEIRKNQTPEKGEDFCTPSYWTAKTDGGQKTCKRLMRYGSEVELKISKEMNGGNRAVLIVDFLRDGEKRDEIYLFCVKEGDKWLMDGFNESNGMIEPFMAGDCSGHFDPTELPADPTLSKIGAEMEALRTDREGLIAYCKERFTSTDNFYFTRQFCDPDYVSGKFEGGGYSNELGRGYMHFTNNEEGRTYEANITLYIIKEEDGTYRIALTHYTSPYSRGFFSLD